jgi:hypothetical protein
VRHACPEKGALLDAGEPHGREGQPLRWVTPQGLGDLALPAADLPMVHTLQLPPLYLITDGHRYGKAGMPALIERALIAGTGPCNCASRTCPRSNTRTMRAR